MVANGARDADTPRFGQAFQPRSHVDAIAVDVVALNDDVAEVDTDAKLDTSRFGNLGIARGHALLDVHGALHRFHDTGKLGQGPVADQFHDAAVMLGDLGIEKLFAVRLERFPRARLVLAHEAAIADHVCGQNCSKPTFHIRALEPASHRLLMRPTRRPVRSDSIAMTELGGPHF